jgi:hypothetical protein
MELCFIAAVLDIITFIHKDPRLIYYLDLRKCFTFTDVYYVLHFYRLSLGILWTRVVLLVIIIIIIIITTTIIAIPITGRGGL